RWKRSTTIVAFGNNTRVHIAAAYTAAGSIATNCTPARKASLHSEPTDEPAKRPSQRDRKPAFGEQSGIEERHHMENPVGTDVEHVQLKCLVLARLRVVHVHRRGGLTVDGGRHQPHIPGPLGGAVVFDQRHDLLRTLI